MAPFYGPLLAAVLKRVFFPNFRQFWSIFPIFLSIHTFFSIFFIFFLFFPFFTRFWLFCSISNDFFIILHIPSISWMNIQRPVYGRKFHALFELFTSIEFRNRFGTFSSSLFFSSIFSLFISFSLAFIANKFSKRYWFSVTSSRQRFNLLFHS